MKQLVRNGLHRIPETPRFRTVLYMVIASHIGVTVVWFSDQNMLTHSCLATVVLMFCTTIHYVQELMNIINRSNTISAVADHQSSHF